MSSPPGTMACLVGGRERVPGIEPAIVSRSRPEMLLFRPQMFVKDGSMFAIRFHHARKIRHLTEYVEAWALATLNGNSRRRALSECPEQYNGSNFRMACCRIMASVLTLCCDVSCAGLVPTWKRQSTPPLVRHSYRRSQSSSSGKVARTQSGSVATCLKPIKKRRLSLFYCSSAFAVPDSSKRFS